jgi:hypothetical protein
LLAFSSLQNQPEMPSESPGCVPSCARENPSITRRNQRFHTHKLVAKIPHAPRCRVTDRRRRGMAALLCLRDTARFHNSIEAPQPPDFSCKKGRTHG